jgi:hypothetical protein
MVRKEDQVKDKYIFEEGMAEISGFGGGYEETCRKMLKAGLEWWDQHPDADPKFHGYIGIYGRITEDNKDAKALSKAVVKGANGDCTGAMHQAVITSIAWIREYGWKKYVKKMKKW